MNQKLRVAFWRFGHILVGRVLEQPEIMRSTDGEPLRCLGTYGAYALASRDSPAIDSDTLYVRGTRRGRDNDFFLRVFPSEETARGALAAFCVLITRANTVEEPRPGFSEDLVERVIAE